MSDEEDNFQLSDVELSYDSDTVMAESPAIWSDLSEEFVATHYAPCVSSNLPGGYQTFEGKRITYFILMIK